MVLSWRFFYLDAIAPNKFEKIAGSPLSATAWGGEHPGQTINASMNEHGQNILAQFGK